MPVVNRQAKNLVTGYQKLAHMERELLARWEKPLLKAYGQRQEKYHTAQKKYQQHRKRLPLTVFVSVGLILIIFLPLLFVWSLAAHITLGLGLLLLALYVVYQLLWAKPQPLQNPLRPPLKDKLFQVPLAAWREKLNGLLPPTEKHGDEDLQDFVELLQHSLDESHLLLYEVQPQHGDDIDLIVIGPKGVWVFEAKCWAGQTTYQRGHWHREKVVYVNGISTTEYPPIGEPPDEQWQRMVDKTKQTFRLRAKEHLWSAPSLMDIQGGIVFTHPTAPHSIEPNLKFKAGSPTYWQRKLIDAPIISEMTEPVILGAVEALLGRHQEINNLETYCMRAHADKLVNQVEQKLKAWL